MTNEEIQKTLENAYHEIGHAFAYVGDSRYIAALQAVNRARDSIRQAQDALDEKFGTTATNGEGKEG